MYSCDLSRGTRRSGIRSASGFKSQCVHAHWMQTPRPAERYPANLSSHGTARRSPCAESKNTQADNSYIRSTHGLRRYVVAHNSSCICYGMVAFALRTACASLCDIFIFSFHNRSHRRPRTSTVRKSITSNRNEMREAPNERVTKWTPCLTMCLLKTRNKA